MIFSHYLQTTDIGANVGATNLYVLLFIQKLLFAHFFMPLCITISQPLMFFRGNHLQKNT